MSAPPRLAVRLLSWALRDNPAAPAILGDLREDFVRIGRAHGRALAWSWYWREAIGLALGRVGQGHGRGHAGALRDAGYALRVLGRTPGFSLFTATMIGLGIGAATCVFSVLRPLMLAPLPFQRADELVWIANRPDSAGASLSELTSRTSNLRDFRERATSFDGLTGYMAFFESGAFTLTGAGEPERLVGVGVAHDFLDVLGVSPLYGRGFTFEEGRWGGPPAVILTHGFWMRRFAGERGVIGGTITLNEKPHTVVGVLPPTFDFASVFTPGVSIDFLSPFPIAPETDGWGNTTAIIGRLRPGVTYEAAQEELDAIVATLQREEPRRWGLGAVVSPLSEHVAGPFRSALVLLAAAAGTLLLIVCVNVSNLILSRSPIRAREIAVRKAFGAPRARLIRQLLLETSAIALVGAAIGSGIAWAATRLVGRAAVRIPLLDRVSVDGWALLVASALAVITGLLVGVLPALRATEGGESAVLRTSVRGGSAGRAERRLRETLVFAEVTLACVLLVVGGLLVQSFRSVLEVDLGYQAEGAVAWQLSTGRSFPDQRERADYYRALAERVAEQPGVEEVGLIDGLPLGRHRTWNLSAAGRPADEQFEIFPHIVDPGYVPAMRIALSSGRNLSSTDTESSPQVVLINESGARRMFGEERALGRRIGGWAGEWEIVGVVADVRNVSPELEAGIQIYFPITQMPDYQSLDLVVRSPQPVEEVVSTVSAALRAMDGTLPTGEFWTLSSTLGRAMSARRFTLGVLSAFGVAALLLAGLGIYGVLAQSVAERRAEIGIRMALGASGAGIVTTLLGRTLLLTGAGVSAGGLLALTGARLFGSLLYGVGVADPVTFAGMAVTLLLVSALAATIPSVRAVRGPGVGALRVDP